MVRITDTKGLLTHDCVQCGHVIQYYDHLEKKCRFCNSSQILFNVTRSTEIQFDFILGQPMWRVFYHLSRTNCT